MGVWGTILYLLFGLGEGILLIFFVNFGTTMENLTLLLLRELFSLCTTEFRGPSKFQKLVSKSHFCFLKMLEFYWLQNLDTVPLYCGELRDECECAAADLHPYPHLCSQALGRNQTVDTSGRNEFLLKGGWALPYCWDAKFSHSDGTPHWEEPVEVFQASPTRKRSWGRSRESYRDYIS